jgi:putative phosphoribosyl transferase
MGPHERGDHGFVPLPFADRADAGRALAHALAERDLGGDVVVLALPRGGVPVAAEVARALRAPLDVFVVRKLGTPGHPELALGAIASGGARVLNDDLIAGLGVPAAAVEEVTRRELEELDRREHAYRDVHPPADVVGRTAVLVDDGLATGATMRAAVTALRATGPARVVVAVPVGAPQACDLLAGTADDVVCLHRPEGFGAVGTYYRDFTQTTDDEVRAVLAMTPGG